MAERIVNGYKRLFEVRLLHHYWLDEGKDVFDSLAEDVRNKRLLTYDVRPLLAVAPTATTEQRLKEIRSVFKTTALGFVVAVPKDVQIPDDALFEFALTVQNADFFNYTALTLRKQKIYELYYPAEDKTYRYKENVFVFSNENGAVKPLHPSAVHPAGQDVLFLSRAIPFFSGTATYQVESLIETTGPLWYQTLADQPLANPPSVGWQEVTDVAKHPVYVNQDDIPSLTAPAGLAGVPERGTELTEDLPDDLFALIRIKTLAAANKFSLLSAPNPSPPAPSVLRSPVFEIRFKNRSTIWKYYDKRIDKTENPDNSLSTEPNPLPLTFFGNASPTQKRKPSAGFVKAKFDNIVPAKIARLVSEIFE